jgi:hypothetical protein
MLKFLILGQQQKTLDCEQAIIVRNEESKKNIPLELRGLGGIILTV